MRDLTRDWPTWRAPGYKMMSMDQVREEQLKQQRDDARLKHLRDIEFVNQNERGK